jgi:single stranded DNA-binding protein
MAFIQSVNLVILVGRVGSIGEFKAARGANGAGYCHFQLATKEKFGDDKVRTDWHSITCWGSMADFVSQHLTVGSLVSVIGKQRINVTLREGLKKKYTAVEARELVVLVWWKKDEPEPEVAPGEAT